jgi:hypothetical protein
MTSNIPREVYQFLTIAVVEFIVSIHECISIRAALRVDGEERNQLVKSVLLKALSPLEYTEGETIIHPVSKRPNSHP